MQVFEGLCRTPWAQIGADGLDAMPGKVEAIVIAPAPRNVQELCSFLGLFKLLWEVCAKSFHVGSPLELSFAAQQEVKMVTEMLTGIKARSLISLYLGTLRPHFTSHSGW